MTTKQRVTFRFSGAQTGPAAAPSNLAVEVHDASFRLVGRGTLDGGVELEPGQDYFISATLPDGFSASTHAKLDPNSTEVVLPQPTSASPDQAADQPALTGAAVLSDAEGAAPWRVSGFCGNLLKGKPTSFVLDQIELTALPTGAGSTAASEVVAAWSVKFKQAGPTYIRLAQPGQPVWNYAVPLSPARDCLVRLMRAGAEFTIDIRLPNSNADLLLRYVGNNLFQEVSQTAESRAILAQDLLGGKFEFPIGAAVGAYVLLRLGQLDRLQDWTKNLDKYFPWMPDGIVVFAEHLARVGEHQQALAKLLELPHRGLPFFSSGLTYAVNRLRVYRGALEKGKLTGDLASLDALSTAFERYAGFVDVTRPILTFMGADPRKPTHPPAAGVSQASQKISEKGARAAGRGRPRHRRG
jgi:hypothetical protein